MTRLLAASAAVCLATRSPAAAQTIDYGALEQLFGEPVTTSVTGSPQRASDVPAEMEIITADEIRRSGARDIPGVLRHVAGVDVLQWGNDDADVSVRGYNQAYSPRLLVLVDGRQVYADFYGFTPWSALPVELSDIRQIEIVKGPSSALFGFNAAGGVINIITYNPLYDEVNTASLIGGTQNLAQGSAVGTTKLGQIGALRISAGGWHDDDFSTPAPSTFFGLQRNDHRASLDADSLFRLSPNVQLGVEVSHVNSGEIDVAADITPASAEFTTNSVKGQLTADTSIGLLQATAYSNRLTTAYGLSELAATNDLVFNNQVTVAQLQDSLKVGAGHTLRATLEYRRDSEVTTPFSGGNVFYDVVATGGMWQWQIMPSLSLTNALRIDHLMLGRGGSVPLGYPLTNADWNRNLTTESFNSGVVWKTGPRDTLRLLVGRGVQLPNLAELGAIVVTTPFGFTGVPTLQPTIVSNYEVGWDHHFPAIGTMLRANAFHQTNDAIASLSSVAMIGSISPYFTSLNVANSRADGIELQLQGKFWQDWRWGLSYTPEIITDTFVPGETNLLTRTDFQHGQPIHVVNANLGWARGPWEVDGFLQYESRFFGMASTLPGATASALTPIDDYVSFDGRVGYRLTDRVTLALSGQNVAISSQTQTSGPKVERRLLGWVTVKF